MDTAVTSHYSLRQLSAFVLACGVYFGGLPHMYSMGLHASGAHNFMAMTLEAVLAWILLGAVYVHWRHWTPLAVHVVCVALSLLLLLNNADVMAQARQFALASLGPACLASILISFPISLGLLALSAFRGRRIEPLSNRLRRVQNIQASSRPDQPRSKRTPAGAKATRSGFRA